MANKTIQTTTIDGKEATVFWITTTDASAGRCKVGYSIGNFNPDPAPGEWTSVKDGKFWVDYDDDDDGDICLLYTSPSPRDATLSRMPSSA